MARRDRDSEFPPPDEKRRGLESVIPDLIKKAVGKTYDRASDAQESIKSFLSESKIPKEIAHTLLQQVDETKSGLFRVVAKEMRGFLEAIDFQRELQKLLTTVSFEIKTEIRFIPNDAAPEKLGRPQIKADMKVKKNDRAVEGKDPPDEPRSDLRPDSAGGRQERDARTDRSEQRRKSSDVTTSTRRRDRTENVSPQPESEGQDPEQNSETRPSDDDLPSGLD